MTSARRCLSFLGILALVWPLAAQAQQDQTIEAIVRRTKPFVGVVIARSPDGPASLGTVFLTYRTGFAITAAHIVADSIENWLVVKFPDCPPLPASKTWRDKDTDVAVLSLNIPEKKDFSSACPPLGVNFNVEPGTDGLAFASPESIREGQQIVVIGFPRPDVLGYDTATITAGVVSAVRDRTVQIQAPVSPGSSGSPVLNMRGQVIGMVRGTLAGDQQGLNFATPVSDLHKALCWGLLLKGVITVDENLTCLYGRRHGARGRPRGAGLLDMTTERRISAFDPK